MLNIAIVGFEWDAGNREKCERHGLSPSLVEEFLRGEVWVAPDLRHSEKEDRFLAVGRSPTKRPMIVAFTFRSRFGEAFIRPISARYMHEKEKKKYAKAFEEDKNE